MEDKQKEKDKEVADLLHKLLKAKSPGVSKPNQNEQKQKLSA